MCNQDINIKPIKLPFSIFNVIDIKFKDSDQVVKCYYILGICLLKRAEVIQ